MTLDWPVTIIGDWTCRKRDHIANTLVRTFCVVMGRIVGQGMPQRPFPEQDQRREHLRFDRFYPVRPKYSNAPIYQKLPAPDFLAFDLIFSPAVPIVKGSIR